MTISEKTLTEARSSIFRMGAECMNLKKIEDEEWRALTEELNEQLIRMLKWVSTRLEAEE